MPRTSRPPATIVRPQWWTLKLRVLVARARLRLAAIHDDGTLVRDSVVGRRQIVGALERLYASEL